MSGLVSNSRNNNRLNERLDWILTDDGLAPDGSNQNANVNGSVTPVKFYRTATRPTWLSRMLVSIRDGAGIRIGQYGGVAALTNGLLLQVIESDGTTVKRDLLGGLTVKSNADWGAYCYDVSLKGWGSGDDFVLVRWTFAAAGEALYLDPGERIQVTIQDDLTGLVAHRFALQGVQK